ncbi:hypothetical protein ERX37_08025 [Macrococcus hajekii]|uniref:SHOCT domain-containing protein n=1 Tax=Macrococcus hajekii TaxID=198482 RepID=A0A4R6BII1_9STAP|nr:hypothetical protein [Macrococcus hajekii]TDM01439.1 hypothetical protein ERX37_08025 [Macrococcus hajekii]GGB00011.1 hypothetical protein GCM10007190_05050 [Macrococcus hajekii]
MKKVLVLTLSSFVLLAACNNSEVKTEKETNEEKKSTEKTTTEIATTERPATKEVTTETPTTEAVTTEQATTENITTEIPTTEQAVVDFYNVTDRGTLESIVYGNYDEGDKIIAYKSAVENGVIPQGNVMEGYAAKAYESSLRVESGAETPVYDVNPSSNPNYDYLFKSKSEESTSSEDEYHEPTPEEAQANLDQLLQEGTITQQEYDQWSQEVQQNQ